MSNNWSKIVDEFDGADFSVRRYYGNVHAAIQFDTDFSLYFSGEGPTVAAALAALDRDIVRGTLTLDQAAEREGIHRNTVLAWLERGWLRGFRGVRNGKRAWLIFPGGGGK